MHQGLELILTAGLETSNSMRGKNYFPLTFKNYNTYKKDIVEGLEEFSKKNDCNLQIISATEDLGFDQISEGRKIIPENWYKKSLDKNNIVLIENIDSLNLRSKKLDNLNSLLLFNTINGISFDKQLGHKFLFILISDDLKFSLFDKSQVVDLNILLDKK